MIEENIEKTKSMILKEKKILAEINSVSSSLKRTETDSEKKMLQNQLEKLEKAFRESNAELPAVLETLDIKRPLPAGKELLKENAGKAKVEKPASGKRAVIPGYKISELDKEILKRLKKGEERKKERKERKPSSYAKLANQLFANKMKTFARQKKFATLEKDLIKSNLNYTPTAYLSISLLSVLVSFAAAFLIFLFLLVFDLSKFPELSFAAGGFGGRLLGSFWVLIVIPALTLLFTYTYPSLEKKSLENKINQELPFATIHMAAISGSLVEPTKIFSIISTTEEYPTLDKEFNKLLNKINVYGYDIVTALKDSAVNCASQKLSELFNGLATTITSGGELYEFFDKRAQTLLFEYRLDKEKNTKAAETFMDIYISVVIAAPMMLMLLLMMIKISGIGISLSTTAITFIIVAGVSLINILFLTFLQIKQPKGT